MVKRNKRVKRQKRPAIKKKKKSSEPTRNRYVKKVREHNLKPREKDVLGEDIPSKMRNLFQSSSSAKAAVSPEDNGQVEDRTPKKRKTKQSAEDSPSEDTAKGSKARKSDLLDARMPGESMRDFERRLKRGTDILIREQSEVPMREIGDGRKERSKKWKEKAKSKSIKIREEREADEGEKAVLGAASTARGLPEVAMEPPRLKLMPRKRPAANV